MMVCWKKFGNVSRSGCGRIQKIYRFFKWPKSQREHWSSRGAKMAGEVKMYHRKWLKMFEFIFKGSNFFDWQTLSTLTNHWSVHEVSPQMNLILRRQLWEGSPASHGHVPCSFTLLTYWLTHNSPPTQKNLTHMLDTFHYCDLLTYYLFSNLYDAGPIHTIL